MIGHPTWKGLDWGQKTEEKNLLSIPGLQSECMVTIIPCIYYEILANNWIQGFSCSQNSFFFSRARRQTSSLAKGDDTLLFSFKEREDKRFVTLVAYRHPWLAKMGDRLSFLLLCLFHANIGVYSVLIILAGCWCPCMVLHHHFVSKVPFLSILSLVFRTLLQVKTNCRRKGTKG